MVMHRTEIPLAELPSERQSEADALVKALVQ